MCGVHKAAWVLLLVGGFNWLLVGLLKSDLFGLMGLGMGSLAARVVYLLVGVSAFMMLMGEKCCLGMGKMGLKDKMRLMLQPCGCGSGKPAWQCCMRDEAEKLGGEPCPCGSGKTLKDCCMKSPETHKDL